MRRGFFRTFAALALLLPIADTTVTDATGPVETQGSSMDRRSADSLASVTALLGRPVVQAWTLVPESEQELPFGLIFDDLRRKIDLRPSCMEHGVPGGVVNCSDVVEWVRNEDNETARGNDWADSFQLDTRGRGAQEYRYPGILVVGMPGGIAEQTLSPILTYFASVGWDLPRLFFVPIGTSSAARCSLFMPRGMLCGACHARLDGGRAIDLHARVPLLRPRILVLRECAYGKRRGLLRAPSVRHRTGEGMAGGGNLVAS
jgi:hypothetical protein